VQLEATPEGVLKGGEGQKSTDRSGKRQEVKSVGHYALCTSVGEGTFGKVKLGNHILTGEKVGT
jgi:5'-AMP-activated protein kinase catalytic alpha subunit/MAP/microtubule affinity-regulating kinase